MWVSLEKGTVVLNSLDAVLCTDCSLGSLVKGYGEAKVDRWVFFDQI